MLRTSTSLDRLTPGTQIQRLGFILTFHFHFLLQVQCHHTIPAEIAEKVSEKILEGKQFCAYIVIPLHPEGDPAASATQEILAWQVKFFEGDVVWGCFGFVCC